MALLLDVTLIAELDHQLAKVFAGLVERMIHDLIGDGESDDGAEGLNCCDDVEDEDCLFHCRCGMRLMRRRGRPL